MHGWWLHPGSLLIGGQHLPHPSPPQRTVSSAIELMLLAMR